MPQLSLTLPPGSNRWPRNRGFIGFISVACAHVILIWALLSMGAVPRMVEPVALLWVSLIQPANTMPSPPLVATNPPTPRLPKSAREVAMPTPATPSLATSSVDSRPVAAADAAPAVATAIPDTPAPAALPLAIVTPEPAPLVTPPARRQLPASAVQYRVLPPAELPSASRRAGESGTVWLRVLVDATGVPAQVSVQLTSGFRRLDEQALWAMRQARFRPHTEGGRAIEVEVIAPIEYPAA